MQGFTCNSCDEEFEITSDSDNAPKYCPFCGDLLNYIPDEDDWEQEEDDSDRGC